MASRKEYELLFQLNAATNGNFSKTLSKAQQDILAMQQKIRETSKLQSDVSAYLKQQKASEETGKKLEVLRQQYDNIQKEIAETGSFSSDLENKLLSKQRQIEKTSAALGAQTQKLNQMCDALRDAGVDTSNLEQESSRLEAQLGELKREQEQAAEGADSFGSRSTRAISSVGDALAAAGIAAALHEIFEAYSECVGVAADFEESLSTVAALSGASSEEMAQLSELAKKLGATTKFTVKESADAMTYMAMAGWDAQQMISGMPGVLNLAAASGEDLAAVSDIVTDSMTAFGLTAKDTAHYADVLAATATNSNTSVATMGETFEQSASLAGALDYSVEDVAVAIGLMANAGIKGSNAGTALKNIFSNLTSEFTLSGAAIGEVTYNTVKADGTMKSFGETVDDLRYYFSQMTSAEKMQNAEALVGQRAMAGFVDIMNASENDFAKLTAKINDCAGAAERMASIRMDNANGQLMLLNSAWEAVQTTIGEQFTPDLQELYGVGADVLGEVNEFLQMNPGLIKGLTAALGIIAAVTTATTAYSAAVKYAIPWIKAFAASTPLGAVIGATTAIAALTGVVVGLANASEDSVPSVKELTAATRELHDTMSRAGDDLSESASRVLATAQVADTYIDVLEDLAPEIDNSDKAHEQYLMTLQMLTDAVPELADRIDLETGSIDGGTAALRENISAWKERAKAASYQEYLSDLMAAYNDVLVEQTQNEVKLRAEERKTERARIEKAKVYEQLLAAIGMTEEQMLLRYGTIEDIPWRQFGEEVKTLQDQYAEYDMEIWRSYDAQRNLQKALNENADAVAEASMAIDDANAVYGELTEAMGDSTTASSALAEQEAALQSILDATSQQLKEMADAYNDAYDAALKSVEGQYKLWDEAAAIIPKDVDEITKAMQAQEEYWDRYASDLDYLREKAQSIEGLSDILADLSDGSAESVNAVAGIAAALQNGKGDVAGMISTYQDLKAKQAEVSDSMAMVAGQFDEKLAQMQADLEDAARGMDVSELSAWSAQQTIQAYIDKAHEMQPLVQAAYDQLGLTVARSLASGVGGSIQVRTNTQGTHRVMGSGYASGTESATPGVHLVGENGPELVFFQGGETVLDSERTRQLQHEMDLMHALIPESVEVAAFMPQAVTAMAARSEAAIATPAGGESSAGGETTQISIPVTINVNGEASSETVEQLRLYGSEFAERVLEVVEEAEADRRRSEFR